MSIYEPYFSVVIPLYNKAPHVRRSISSVLKQSFSDYELIVINDASTDNSVEELSTFDDKRIRLLHRSKPGAGGYAARNLGIKNAAGQWIAFLDADDEWYPEHLQKIYDMACSMSEICFLSCGWYSKIDNSVVIDPYYRRNSSRGPHILDLKEYLKSCLNNARPVCTIVACMLKDSQVADDLFPTEAGLQRGGDVYAWLKLMCHHKRMGWSDHIGAVYHKDSINMVTNNTFSTTHLKERAAYNVLAAELDSPEKKMLKKYFNKRLKYSWLENRKNRRRNFNLIGKLFWKGDFFIALKYSIGFIFASLLNPEQIEKWQAKRIKKWVK